MRIRGFQKFSLIDYPEKIAAIIFTPGCTLRCPFCYNPELVRNDPALPRFKVREILDFLQKRKGKLEALVITGGEPTLQQDLPDFVARVKKMGYAVKLDTNGTHPEMLNALLQKKLVDYVAMDFKTDWFHYAKLKPQVPVERIKASVSLLLSECGAKGVGYEFRTTVVPILVNAETIRRIGENIRGAALYALQQYRPQKTLVSDYCPQAYPQSELENFQRIAQIYVSKVELRGI